MTLKEWGKLFSDMKYRRIANTKFKGYTVSTVWTGYSPSGTRWVIFETMVFTDHINSSWSDYQERYDALSEAEAGHRKIVNEVKEAIKRK